MHKWVMVLSSRTAANATCALKTGLWVRRVRRADFLTIVDSGFCQNSFSPGLTRPSIISEVPTYSAVQISGATSHISQQVFARYLNVSKNLVSDWDRGVKKPGPALRLLTLIQKKGLEAIAGR